MIVPNDTSRDDAYFDQLKNPKIILNILVVINVDVVRRHKLSLYIVKNGTSERKKEIFLKNKFSEYKNIDIIRNILINKGMFFHI